MKSTNLGVDVVMKNCEPLVSFPALAMLRRPFLECLILKFSSGNFSPQTREMAGQRPSFSHLPVFHLAISLNTSQS